MQIVNLIKNNKIKKFNKKKMILLKNNKQIANSIG